MSLHTDSGRVAWETRARLSAVDWGVVSNQRLSLKLTSVNHENVLYVRAPIVMMFGLLFSPLQGKAAHGGVVALMSV